MCSLRPAKKTAVFAKFTNSASFSHLVWWLVIHDIDLYLCCYLAIHGLPSLFVQQWKFPRENNDINDMSQHSAS
jgi:hypothetical protein